MGEETNRVAPGNWWTGGARDHSEGPLCQAIVGYIGWQRRVTRPLAVTRKTVTEDLQWVKERLA